MSTPPAGLEIVAAAARRIADYADAIAESHDLGLVAPGAIDSLASPDYHRRARPVHLRSVDAAELERLGLAFGVVAGTMAGLGPHPVTADERWSLVSQFLRHSATSWAPGPSTVETAAVEEVAAWPPPLPLRYDELAVLVSRPAPVEMAGAARWVGEVIDGDLLPGS